MDWANWRGPNYNGATEAKGLPTEFSPTKNVVWATPMPGISAATPIVAGDLVYTTAADHKNQALLAIALDRKTGKVRWQEAMGTGYRPAGQGDRARLDERSHYAAPSPVTDGRRVIFFFGNGDLAAFTPAGRKLWQRNLQQDYGDFAFQWTFSSSPQLWNGRVYVQILQRDRPVGPRGKQGAESFLLALNPDSGREIWRVTRPSQAVNESRESYGTPIPHVFQGKRELLVTGGDVVTGHDPATGKELWRWGTWNEGHREMWWRLVPSPVAGDGVVLVCAPKRAPVYAVGPDAQLAWKSEERSPVTSDVPTPCFYQGKFYVLSDVRKSLSCLEPRSGRVAWSVPLPGRQMCWSSPTAADGKLYFFDHDGLVYVVDATSGQILAQNPMAENGADLWSTIAIADNRLYLRTGDRLFCLGQ